MTDYVTENTEKYIPDKSVREAILLKLPRSDKLDPVKKLDDFLVELLKQKKNIDVSVDNIFEKDQDKVADIMCPLSKLMGDDRKCKHSQ